MGWLVLLLVACNEAPPSTYQPNCTANAPSAEALKPPGGDGKTSILPGGRALTPSGSLFDVGGYPLSVRLLPASGTRAADRYAVVSDGARHDEALRIVDLQNPAQPIVAHADYPINAPGQPGLLYGMALTRDGQHLYVSNGGSDPIGKDRPITEHY